VRRAACFALLAATAGCQTNAVTRAGTEIVHWTAPASFHPFGARAKKDVRINARPERKGQAVFAVHVETGRVAPVDKPAPLAVSVTVERNGDWTFDATCKDEAGGPGAAPVVSCTVQMRYADTFNEVKSVLTLEIAGDGSVRPTLPGGQATLE